MSSKKTKRSLLTSLLALALCLVLFVGSTFAWFTDSASTGVNRIVAGELKVDLLLYRNGAYSSIKNEEGALFGGENSLVAQNDPTDTLWEPGKTQIVFLAVKNLGSLALKYQLLIDTQDLGLCGALEYAVMTGAGPENVNAAEMRWSEYEEAADQTGFLPAGRTLAASGDLLEANESDLIALILHMDENAGSAYQGKSVELDVSVVATQAVHEADSINNTYDERALFPALTAASLKEALASGGAITLGKNISLPLSGEGNGVVEQMNVSKDTTLDLSGKTLAIDLNSFEGELSYVATIMTVHGATLTVEGNGVLNAEAGYNTVYGINVMDGGKVIINSGTFYGAMSAVQVQNGELEINGGFFDLAPTIKAAAPVYAKYLINAIDQSFRDGTAKIQIKGGTFVNFNPADHPEAGETTYVAAGYHVVSEVQANGDTWYTVVAD